LTAKVLDLGYAYLNSLSLSEWLEPAMVQLAAHLDLPCSASVLDGGDIVIVSIVQGPTERLLRFNAHVGTRLPAYPGAMGRVLLGGLPPAELEAYLATVKIERLTKYTVRTRKELRSAIETARAQGWCVVDRERDLGVVSLAVPLVGGSGRVIAALNVSVHAGTASANDLKRDFLPELRRAAATINAGLRTR
jgi:IclR family pca regulon transcriptional regulator